MYEDKPGEIIANEYEQIDREGYRIARVRIDWFGYTNEEANLRSLDLIRTLLAMTDGWRKEKAGIKEKPANR